MIKILNMKQIILTTALLIFVNISVNSQNNYVFKELPYSYDALEPYIDATTMETHYDKHHRGYYNKFVQAMQDGNYGYVPIDELFKDIEKYPVSIRNTGGGYWNHEFFWESMNPEKTEISKDLLKAINKQFGSVDNFKSEFSKAANTLFGSGWAWLILTDKNELKIVQTQNQDNPLMSVVQENGTPLLAIDVWEHAYYLKHKNKRADYVNDFWNVVNWQKVSERYKDAKK